MRAEHRLGELTREMPKQHGARGVGKKSGVAKSDSTPTYAAMGIDKRDAAKWQQSAAMPIARFDEVIAETRAKGERLTTNMPLKLARTGHKGRSGRPQGEGVARVPRTRRQSTSKARESGARRLRRQLGLEIPTRGEGPCRVSCDGIVLRCLACEDRENGHRPHHLHRGRHPDPRWAPLGYASARLRRRMHCRGHG
jgi:hypothetical protein